MISTYDQVMGFAVVLAGGDIPDRRLFRGIDAADLVVAADGGVRIARSHGLPIDAVIGDLDSSSEGDLAWATAEGSEIHSFPADKNATDLQLALGHADAAVNIDRIVVMGIEGGRLDHEMGNWAVCCGQWRAAVDIHTERGVTHVLRGAGRNVVELDGEPGDLVSLLPRGGKAVGVQTVGLRWPLDEAVLYPDDSRGLSNELVETSAKVSLHSGVLLVSRPTVATLA